MMIARCVSETATELVDKIYINPLLMAFFIVIFGFGIAYIVVLLSNSEVK